MGPELQPDVPLMEVALYAIFNPATIAVAFWLGRKADAKNKLLIAAFGGAIAGVAALYIAALLRIWDAPTVGRAAAGVFVASLVTGLIYARIGYATKR
ncbi:MAG: hypothetical protein K2X41_08715 [Hyphomicrobium sp.]|nr:hypothetical protein [Hyphomicrobium sp.]